MNEQPLTDYNTEIIRAGDARLIVPRVGTLLQEQGKPLENQRSDFGTSLGVRDLKGIIVSFLDDSTQSSAPHRFIKACNSL